jgi:hypothetical protein
MKRRLTRISGGVLQRGRSLAWWLNYGREHQGDKTFVVRLLGLLRQLDDILQPNRGTPLWKLAGVRELEAELDKLTRPRQFWRRYGAESDASGIGFGYIPLSSSHEEGQSTQMIDELLSVGALDRLVLCATCNRHWIFRRRSHEKYCSTACRQAPYEAKPERREQKRKTSANSYRQQKRMAKLALQRAQLEVQQSRERRRKR